MYLKVKTKHGLKRTFVQYPNNDHAVLITCSQLLVKVIPLNNLYCAYMNTKRNDTILKGSVIRGTHFWGISYQHRWSEQPVLIPIGESTHFVLINNFV